MQFRRVTYSALAVAALFGFASASASAAIINFDQSSASSPTGNVSYDGEGGALKGSGIGFDEIALINATAPNEATLTCDGCVLSFNTGANISEGPDTWSFSGGGSLSISGQAKDSNGDVVAGSNNTDLVTGGTFNGTQEVNQEPGDTSLEGTLGGTDIKSSDLLSYFGLDGNSDFMFANTVISLNNATFGDNGSIDADVTGADFQNTGGTAVPEPQEVGLFALGAVLLAAGLGWRRRRCGAVKG